jgi:hypothetical protein
MAKDDTTFSEYRIYKPRQDAKTGKYVGCASKFEFKIRSVTKKDKVVRVAQMFWVAAEQLGLDEKGNAKFAWDDATKRVDIKLGEPDWGEILAVLKGKKGHVGRQADKGLFHKNTKGNSSIQMQFVPGKDGYESAYSVRVSSQKDGKVVAIKHMMTLAEAVILEVLLENVISRRYGW